MCGCAFPNYFILEAVFPEHLVHQHFDVVADVPIEVHVDAGVVRHDGFDGHEILVHPVEVVLFGPDVAVHLLVESAELVVGEFLFGPGQGGCDLGISADVDFLGVVGAGGEGRVDVDEVDLDARLLEMGAGGEALAADHQAGILLVRPADGFQRVELIARHAAGDAAQNLVAVAVGEQAAGADEVVEHGLALDGLGKIGNVVNGHGASSGLRVIRRLRRLRRFLDGAYGVGGWRLGM